MATETLDEKTELPVHVLRTKHLAFKYMAIENPGRNVRWLGQHLDGLWMISLGDLIGSLVQRRSDSQKLSTQAEVYKSESRAFCKEMHVLREKIEDLLEETKEMARRVAQLAAQGSKIVNGQWVVE
ncbi:MAG: hypothetical protein L6R42_008153 [Xanthoria sp. 1 TBL-2021]|nr:MAG: hypothetical protein L6R42_008153 [Xanthoria sp. 1 TBL-2021]